MTTGATTAMEARAMIAAERLDHDWMQDQTTYGMYSGGQMLAAARLLSVDFGDDAPPEAESDLDEGDLGAWGYSSDRVTNLRRMGALALTEADRLIRACEDPTEALVLAEGAVSALADLLGEEQPTREKVIVSIADELDACLHFAGDTVKSLTWATRIFNRAIGAGMIVREIDR